MIKFFRKTRQNLLNDCKTARYFKYAIGEIVLVVIGILIALQINTWNNEQRINKEEKATLIKIIEDLKSDNKRFIKIIDFYTEYAKRLVNEKKLIFKKSLSDDDIKQAMLFSGARIQNLNPRRTTYQEMLNSGRLYNLSNQMVVNTIIEYYRSLDDSIYNNKEDRKEFRALFYGADLTDFWFWRGYESPFEYAKLFFQNQDANSYHVLQQSAGWSVAINNTKLQTVKQILNENILLIEMINKVLKGNKL